MGHDTEFKMNPTTLAALANFPDLPEANFSAVPIGWVHWRPDSWEGIPSERLTAMEQIGKSDEPRI